MNANGTLMMAAPENDCILASTNFGVDWLKTGFPTANWVDVVVSGDGSYILAIDVNTIFVSSDNGTSYNSVVSEVSPSSACMSYNGSHMYIAGDGGGVITSTDFGAVWSKVGVVHLDYTSIACSSNGQIVVLGVVGNLFISTG